MITRPVHFDYGTLHKISPPTAVIDLCAQHEDWEVTDFSSECAVGGISPPKKAHAPLRRKKNYDIGLRLDLPRSPANEKCGMFMVNAILLDGERVKLGSSKRPEILPYTSNLVHGIRVIASWPFFIWGSRKEVEQVDIDLFINYIEVPDRPLHFVELYISRPCVQVAGARITIEPHLYGFQWLMKHYFLTSALAGIFFINSVFEVLIVLVVLWLHLLKSNKAGGQRQQQQQQQSSGGTHPVEDNFSTQLHSLGESVPETVPQIQGEMQFSNDSSSYSAMLSEEVESYHEVQQDYDVRSSEEIGNINSIDPFGSPSGVNIRRRQPHNLASL